MGKRELVALLNLSSWCLVMVEPLFLAVPRGCLQFVIVVFPDHTHFFKSIKIPSYPSIYENVYKLQKIFLVRFFWLQYIFRIKFKIPILDLKLLPKNCVPFEGLYSSTQKHSKQRKCFVYITYRLLKQYGESDFDEIFTERFHQLDHETGNKNL